MNWSEAINQALEDASLREDLLSALNPEISKATWENRSRDALRFRWMVRLINRTADWETGRIGHGDMLAVLRDYRFFVGPVQLPDPLRSLAQAYESDFGFFIVGSTLQHGSLEPKAFPVPKYLRQLYQAVDTNDGSHPSSSGDVRLYRATGFRQYKSFEQKTAVHTCLDMPPGSSALISLPTGAGKSLITWMMVRWSRGLTVLVVPTIALALDQVRAAQHALGSGDRPIRIAYWAAGMSSNERMALLDDIHSQQLDLLVVSPEALSRNGALWVKLKKASESGYLQYFIVDEAHIVHDWGNFFRPDFHVIASVRRALLKIAPPHAALKTILLSATITEGAEQELRKLFSDKRQPWISLRGDSLRVEPRYVVETSSNQDTHTMRIRELVRMLPKPLIVYEVTRERADFWQKQLREDGFKNVAVFTGDTPDMERARIVEAWSRDELDVVVGTSAFGMGVDKPDVRTVIHASIPENINRFYQEVGRGGRDGLACLSIVSYCASEPQDIQKRLGQRLLSVDLMAKRWISMFDQAVEVHGLTRLLDGGTAPFYYSEQEEQNKGQTNVRWNMHVLFFLAKCDFISMDEVIYDAEKSTYFIRVSLSPDWLTTLQNLEAVQAALKEPHDREAEQMREGYDAMKLLISQKGRCIGPTIADIFPDAEPSCGGCMSRHDPYRSDRRFLLARAVAVYDAPATPMVASGWTNVLLARPKQETKPGMEAWKAAMTFNRLGYRVLVMPFEEWMPTIEFDGLTLTPEEFLHLTRHHRSLIWGGIYAYFGNDSALNQSLFDQLRRFENQGQPVVYVASPDMLVVKEHKTLDNLVNGRVSTYSEIPD